MIKDHYLVGRNEFATSDMGNPLKSYVSEVALLAPTYKTLCEPAGEGTSSLRGVGLRNH